MIAELIAFGRYAADGELSAAARMAICITSIILSIMSYHLVENPVRRRQAFASRKSLFIAAIIATLSGIVIGSLIWLKEGFPQRLPTAIVQPFRVNERASLSDLKKGLLPHIGDHHPGSKPRFVVWGDSHAGMFLDVLDEMAKQRGIAGLNAAMGGNPPIPEVSISWNQGLPEWTSRIIQIIEEQDIRNVILIARWSMYLEGATPYDQSQGMHFKAPLLYATGSDERSLDRSRALYRKHFGQLLRHLLKSGRKVYLVSQVPELPYNPARALFIADRTFGIIAGHRHPPSLVDHASRQAYFESTLDAFGTANVIVLSPTSLLFDDSGNLISNVNLVPTYRDNQHLSAPGARFVGESIFAKLLDDIATENGLGPPEQNPPSH